MKPTKTESDFAKFLPAGIIKSPEEDYIHQIRQNDINQSMFPSNFEEITKFNNPLSDGYLDRWYNRE